MCAFNAFCLREFNNRPHSLPVVTTSSGSSICPECGAMKNSYKLSCCARGGSWFRNCGSARHTNLAHTWQEGIWACKARQAEVEMVQQLHASQTESNASAIDAGMGTKESMAVAQMLTFARENTSVTLTHSANPAIVNSMTSGSAAVTVTTPSLASASTSLIAPEYGILLHAVARMGTTFIAVCLY